MFVADVTADVGSHTPRAPVSRYQKAFVRCDAATSLPKDSNVSKYAR